MNKQMNKCKLKIMKSVPIAISIGTLVYLMSRTMCKSSGLSITINPDKLTPENAMRSAIALMSGVATSTAIVATAVVASKPEKVN